MFLFVRESIVGNLGLNNQPPLVQQPLRQLQPLRQPAHHPLNRPVRWPYIQENFSTKLKNVWMGRKLPRDARRQQLGVDHVHESRTVGK
jgi:hypothetical protein